MDIKDLNIYDRPVDDLLKRLADSGDGVDLQPAFSRFTLASIAGQLFGEPVSPTPQDAQ